MTWSVSNKRQVLLTRPNSARNAGGNDIAWGDKYGINNSNNNK